MYSLLSSGTRSETFVVIPKAITSWHINKWLIEFTVSYRISARGRAVGRAARPVGKPINGETRWGSIIYIIKNNVNYTHNNVN